MGGKHKHEEHEHVDESWLIPYADLLTLLLALFIVLFATSQTVDKQKFDQMIASFSQAFNKGTGFLEFTSVSPTQLAFEMQAASKGDEEAGKKLEIKQDGTKNMASSDESNAIEELKQLLYMKQKEMEEQQSKNKDNTSDNTKEKDKDATESNNQQGNNKEDKNLSNNQDEQNNNQENSQQSTNQQNNQQAMNQQNNQQAMNQNNQQNSMSQQQSEAAMKENQELMQLQQQLNQYIKENGLSSQLETNLNKDQLVIRIKDQALYGPGSATVRPESRTLALSIADVLIKYPEYEIVISGHADNRPVSNSEFESNWDLSSKRAVNFMKILLTRENIDPKRFSAVGYGEFRPIASNDTAEGRAKNRRVEISILRNFK